MIGDSIAGAITLLAMPWNVTASLPLATSVAPMTPPISAWLELEGSVKHQVIEVPQDRADQRREHERQPGVCRQRRGLTIPLAIVAATLIEMNAPTRLSTADISTATRGFSAPVAIEVATALAVS